MEYIVNSAFGATLYQKGKRIDLKMSSITFIKQLCLKHLTSYESYLKSCRHVFGYQYKIPLVLSNELKLIQTRSIKNLDTVWFNMSQVYKYTCLNDQIKLYFYSGNNLKIVLSKTVFMKLLSKLKEIDLYRVKTFS